MKRFILPVMLLTILACTPPLNRETINHENETILIGNINWDGLTQAPYDEWFKHYYFDYDVDSTTLDLLGESLQDVDVVMFLGTWCSDSQFEVPQFYKILDHLSYDISRMKVIALERLENGEMVSPKGEEDKYEITHVPTMIFLRYGQEIGRITEYPTLTFEKDMVKIILGEK